MNQVKRRVAKKSRKQNIKGKAKISIKARMIMSYFLCVAIPLIIVNIFSSNNSNQALKTNSSRLATEMVQQASVNVSSFDTQIVKMTNRIIINELNASSSDLTTKYLLARDKGGTNGKLDTLKYRADILSQIRYTVNLDETVKNIAVVIGDDVITTYVQDDNRINLKEEEILQFCEFEIPGKLLWITDFPGHEDAVYIMSNLNNLKSGKVIGRFIMEVNIEPLIEQIQNIQLFDGAEVFLLDSNGTPLSSTEGAVIDEAIEKAISTDAQNGEEEIDGRLISFAKSSNNWTIAATIPVSTLTIAITKSNHVVWILIVISVLVATAAGFLISRGIAQSILKIRASMKQAETGDLSSDVVIKSQDELGELGMSFNNMMKNIRVLIEETQQTIEKIFGVSSILKKSTNQSIHSFNQLSVSIEHIAEGSTLQAEDTQNGAMMMDNLADSIKVVLNGTQEVYAKSEGTRKHIEEASKNMKRLNEVMNSTSAIASDIRHSVISLSELTKAIGEIMTLLDGISEQTNLLALNASIEAARAGDVGKGFAVVANEVRNLSEQSKISTSNVKNTLKEIENKAQQAVNLVNKSDSYFKEQEKVAVDTERSLAEMIHELEGINLGINEVSSRSQSMNQLKNDVSEKIESITTVTEETAASTEELNALSEEQKAVMEELTNLADGLNSQLEGLKSAINKFRL